MEGPIIVGGMLGSLYLATLMFCVLQEFDAADAMNASFWEIALAVLNAFKMSLFVFVWVILAIAWLIAIVSPLLIALHFAGMARIFN